MRHVRRPSPALFLAAGSALLIAGCATPAVTPPPRTVPPEELPALEARLAADPADPDLQRLVAASLVAADRCGGALAIARPVAPTADAAWPVLVEGQCLESAGDLDAALALYRAYLAEHAGGRGAPAVRGRLVLAEERFAVVAARSVVAGEIPMEPGPESTVAVLPLEVSGDPGYAPLSRGLAAQINSDLLMLDRFSLVERLNLQAILTELERSSSPMMDSTTTPAFGRMVRAGRLVAGSAEIARERPVRLSADVVLGTGEVVGVGEQSGALEDLLRLEKELVFGISRELGYTVSEAERVRILNNGTQNLMAFLAYSEGQDLMYVGDFAGASAQFAEAYRLDPGFEGARLALEGATGANGVIQSGPTRILEAAYNAENAYDDATEPASDEGFDPLDLALVSGINDVASTQGEQSTGTGGAIDAIENLTAAPTVAPLLLGLIRIVVIIPG